MLRLSILLLLSLAFRGPANGELNQSAKSKSQGCSDSALELGLDNIRHGRFREALEITERALRSAPFNPDLYEMLGDIYTGLQDSNRAIEAYGKSLLYDPHRFSAYEKRGHEYYKQKDWDHTISDYSKAIQIQSEAMSCYYNRAAAYRQLCQYDKARADFEYAYKGGLVNPTAYVLAALLATCPVEAVRDGKLAIEYAQVACKQTSFKEYAPLSMLAAAYAEAGQWDEAIRRSQQALELAEGPLRATERLNSELYQFHERNRVLTPNLVAKTRPSTAGEALIYALVKKSTGDRLGAIADLRIAIEWNPRLSAAHCELGGLIAPENLSKAINHYNRSLEVNPKSVESLIWRGTAHLYAGKYREALRDSEAALTLDAKDDGARALNQCALAACGKIDSALRELEKWTQEHPQVPAHTVRGHCYLFQGRLNDAVTELTEALRRDPRDILSYANRAVALSALGREQAAKQDLAACIRLAPSLRAPTEARMRDAKAKRGGEE